LGNTDTWTITNQVGPKQESGLMWEEMAKIYVVIEPRL